eukprot:TRINITY_DN7033_c0_g1_i1.p1 TRINITY_DN7033_c0_g1~~TRINITY_DN7033_c0_g1_i1.p1  ORF type:complete len:539 (-),score=78.38 TRINITY_DN7033_c0_g1_i1:20-1570(-)
MILFGLLVSAVVGARLPPASIPHHPFMGRNGFSHLHCDAYLSDVHDDAALESDDWVLIHSAPTAAAVLQTVGNLLSPYGGIGLAFAGSLFREGGMRGPMITTVFDSLGRMLTVSVMEAKLFLVDVGSLSAIAEYQLPPKTTSSPAAMIASGFSKSAQAQQGMSTSNYVFFYIDHTDAVVVATRSSILRVRIDDSQGTPVFRAVQEVELGHLIDPADMLQTTLPDYKGRMWWTTDRGLVGTVDLELGSSSARLVNVNYASDERQYNAFSADEDGKVYTSTNRAVYAFATHRAEDGTESETVVWREEYPNDRVLSFSKGDGSGTSPKLFGDGYKLLAIMDNLKTPQVTVYWRSDEYPSKTRLVCTVPVLNSVERVRTETSFIGYRNSLIITNNYGLSPLGLPFPSAGVARVDVVDPVEGVCKVVWENTNVVSVGGALKMSTQTGLVYVSSVAWSGSLFEEQVFVTALDFHTGAVVRNYTVGQSHGFFPTWSTPTFTPAGDLITSSLLGLHKLSPRHKH